MNARYVEEDQADNGEQNPKPQQFVRFGFSDVEREFESTHTERAASESLFRDGQDPD